MISNQRFESILNLVRINLITRHTSTQRVSYGNLSQASFTNFPRRTPTQGFWSYLLTPGCESAAFRLITPSSLPLIWGYVQYSVRRFQSVKYCELRRFTGPIKRYVTSTVQ